MSRIPSVPRVNPQSFTPAGQHGLHVDQQIMSHNTNNPATAKAGANNRKKLDRKQLNLLAKLGDITSENFVQNWVELLVANGYSRYQGLWEDVQAAVPDVCKIKEKHAQAKLKKLETLRRRVAKNLNKRSWNAVKRMDLVNLSISFQALKILSQKQLVYELFIQKQERQAKQAKRAKRAKQTEQAKQAKQAERAKSKQVVLAAEVKAIFLGSDGKRSKTLYSQLERIGPLGRIAALCLRTQKAADRAKLYILPEYKRIAYETQNKALTALVDALKQSAIIQTWGWGRDETRYYKWVLYVDLPQGQVSWHNERKIGDQNYPNQPDDTGLSQERVLAFAARLIDPLFETSPIAPASPHTS